MTMYDYFIMNDKQVVTIPYNKCIDYFCELYDVGDAYKHSFQSLNHLRNTIMHLGVNYKEQYYVLVGCIDKALWFIQYEIINKLIADGNVGKHLEIALFQIENTLSEIEDVLWKQLYQPSINTFAAKVDDAFHDTIVQEYLKTKKRTIEVSPTTDMDHACLRVTIEDAVLEEEMFSAYHDPPTNSIIIDDGQSNAVVMAVFCLNDNGEFPKKFYLSKDKDGVLVAKIDHQSKFWLQAEYKNCFHYLDCNKQNLTKLLTTIIDYCDDAKFSTTQT